MNTNNLQIENHEIISIITKGYIGNCIVNRMVKANLNTKIVVWENSNEYHSCERVQLTFTTNLKELFCKHFAVF